MGRKPVQTKEAEDEFFVWVGRSIKCWSKVEQNLFDICFLTLHPHRLAAGVVYWRQPSLDVRLNLLTDLLEARLDPAMEGSKRPPPSLLKQWPPLREKLRSLLSFRNFVAHHPAWFRFEVAKEDGDKGDGARWDYKEFWHTRQNLDDEARRPSKHKEVGVADMKEHVATVIALNHQLRDFVIALEPLLVKLPPRKGEEKKG